MVVVIVVVVVLLLLMVMVVIIIIFLLVLIIVVLSALGYSPALHGGGRGGEHMLLASSSGPRASALHGLAITAQSGCHRGGQRGRYSSGTRTGILREVISGELRHGLAVDQSGGARQGIANGSSGAASHIDLGETRVCHLTCCGHLVGLKLVMILAQDSTARKLVQLHAE